jgi:hypothetical protein
MSEREGHGKEARALRIYEYMDDDGMIFWSFAYLPGRSMRRLTLTDNRGAHFRAHISDVHQMAFEAEVLKKSLLED